MAQLQRLAIAPSQFQQEQILLTPQEQHYLGRVLRLCDGDRFIAMDGKGKWWLAQLEGEKAQILESLTVETELPVSITLIVALPKGNGFDDVVRCCTELGVAVIAAVVSDRLACNTQAILKAHQNCLGCFSKIRMLLNRDTRKRPVTRITL